jgi:predicted amidohydrolase
MAICRDMSFPESARVMAIKGMDLLITMSAGPYFTKERWNIVNPVRAMDNDVFHIYSNVVGTQWGDVNFWGGAMIISPAGDFLAKGKVDEEDLIVAELKVQDLLECRKTHCYMRDRRHHIRRSVRQISSWLGLGKAEIRRYNTIKSLSRRFE